MVSINKMMIMCVSDNVVLFRKGGCELDQPETKVDITTKLEEGKYEMVYKSFYFIKCQFFA